MFVSVGTQGGGMETTALTFATHFAHHGMPFIPAGYAFGPKMYGLDDVRGGSPWGPGTFAGATGERQPSDTELEFAEHYGMLLLFLGGRHGFCGKGLFAAVNWLRAIELTSLPTNTHRRTVCIGGPQAEKVGGKAVPVLLHHLQHM